MNDKYDFQERLEFSHGMAPRADVEEILRENIPACIGVQKATEKDDRNGTDWWCIRRPPLRNLSVDVKVRDVDPIEKCWGDDLALETWSVINEKVGWTRDATKQTDFILWMFVPTGRWVLVPFPMLCKVFQDKWRLWSTLYKRDVQDSGSWKSECIFVPRRELWKALYIQYAGTSARAAAPSVRRAKPCIPDLPLAKCYMKDAGEAWEEAHPIPSSTTTPRRPTP